MTDTADGLVHVFFVDSARARPQIVVGVLVVVAEHAVHGMGHLPVAGLALDVIVGDGLLHGGTGRGVAEPAVAFVLGQQVGIVAAGTLLVAQFMDRGHIGCPGDMAGLADIDDAGMKVMPLSAGSEAEIVTVHLMTEVAGGGVIAVAVVAIGPLRQSGMEIVQRSARAAGKASVAGVALAKGLPQRSTARRAGDMAGLAVGDETGMEVVPRGSWSIAEIMHHHPKLGRNHLVAGTAGRGSGAVAGGTVAGPESAGVLLVQ